MNPDQLSRIKNYAKTLNPKIENEGLLDFAIEDCVGRVLLYLSEDVLAENLERIVASIVSMNYLRLANFSASGENEYAISSVSDNGQSVSYSTSPKQTLLTARDDEIFLGFEAILKNHRRINVVS